jgi:hypothetical protein
LRVLCFLQLVMPDVTALQTTPETRYQWIDYSTLDAQATWLLRESLECKLRNMPVAACKILTDEAKVKEPKDRYKPCGTMWDFYQQYWKPFGELLVDMERNGMFVDNGKLQEAEKLATEHQQTAEDRFRNWAAELCPDARWMNVGSGSQVRLLAAAVTPRHCVLTVLPLMLADPATAVCWPAGQARRRGQGAQIQGVQGAKRRMGAVGRRRARGVRPEEAAHDHAQRHRLSADHADGVHLIGAAFDERTGAACARQQAWHSRSAPQTLGRGACSMQR